MIAEDLLEGRTRARGGLIVDLFAGGGGASEGIRLALGRAPDVAVNHDPDAIAMHAINHPDTVHYCRSIYDVSPWDVAAPGEVDLLWASPDCTHFSRAKGGKPREKAIRDLPWIVVDWARAVRPRVIGLENVAEITTWGPLGEDGQPIPELAGTTWRAFLGQLEAAGYAVDFRVLNAADFGAPTARRRLFLVARCDGRPIRWPEPSHGPGRAAPWRTAAECIDWSLPIPSIFERRRPLAEATERRIAEGVRRYVLNTPRPFLVNLGDPDQPVAPAMIQTGYGERPGQAPRVLDLQRPLGTVVAGGPKHALVAAFMVKHYGGVVGHRLDQPIGTVTTIDHHAVGAVFLDKLHGSASAGQPLDRPAPTITAGGGRGGGHAALCAALLARYYGEGGQWSGLDQPLPTIVTKDRFALVTVQIDGQPYVLADIGMRMLQPHELKIAQGFGEEYVLVGNKANQTARIGNSVPPQAAAAVVGAQFAA